jgi:hypothetical protein
MSSTPTLPHIPLPDVTLPRVNVHDVTERVTERAGDVGELVSDVWSTGMDRAQDLAAAAFDVLEDIPDKAVALAGAVIPALRPSPKRSKRPLVLVAAAIATFVVVAWFLKKRRAGSAEPYAVPTGGSADAQVSAAS